MGHADLDLCYATATGIAELIRTRKVSALEVTRNALARLDEVEPELNTFVHRDDEGALAMAKEADARLARGGDLPPLLGVPVSVKDLIEVGRQPCGYGSRTMSGYVAPTDAPSVARLRSAGMVILGKTTTSEFGYRGYTSSLVHGVTRNPWDTSRTPGGSIRAPCSFTNLIGIKPQFGRVPVFPASATPTLAHVGPIARSPEDARLLLSIIAGPDERDWTSLQPSLNFDAALPNLKRLRVAFSPTLGYASVYPEVAQAVALAVERIRSATPNIEEVNKVCDDPGEILATEFIAGCSARFGSAVDLSPDDIDPPLLAAIRALRERTVGDYAEVLRARFGFREHMRKFFERYDVLLTPTTPAPAWKIGESVPTGLENAKVWVFFTYPFNLTGQPAASVPCGFTRDGLPIGLQVSVRPQAETLLCELIQAYDRILGCSAQRPPGFCRNSGVPIGNSTT